MKEHVTKTKDMLEARVDQVIAFEDKLQILGDEVSKVKMVHEDFKKKMIEEIGKTNAALAEDK